MQGVIPGGPAGGLQATRMQDMQGVQGIADMQGVQGEYGGF